jgi:hypothetical protein
MVLLPGCGCCQTNCTICPDWCSYTMQILSPQVLASGVLRGDSARQSCNGENAPLFSKTYGVCPGYTYTNTAHVHDICRFETCDTTCSIGGFTSAEIQSRKITLSRAQINSQRGFGTATGNLGIGLSASIGSFGFANCESSPEARYNGAVVVAGLQCTYIPSVPASRIDLFVLIQTLVGIIDSSLSYVYYRQRERRLMYPLDRVCGVEQLDRKCDFESDTAIRILPPEGFFPFELAISQSGTSLGAWETDDDVVQGDTSHPAYLVGQANFDCLSASFAPVIRFGRRQCRDLNPLP